MDKELFNRLVIIAALFGCLVAMYYIMSPYQKCVETDFGLGNDPRQAALCFEHTSW